MRSHRTPPVGPADALERRRAAFRVLYDNTYDDLWRYVQRRSVSEAEARDALADVFLVAWRRFDDIPVGDGARPWLFGVARNTLRSGWRNRQRSAALTERLSAEMATRPAVEPDPGTAADAAELLAALATLRESDRELIRLVAWDELPHSEIAQIIGCSENAVAIRLHRARARLAKALQSPRSRRLASQIAQQGES